MLMQSKFLGLPLEVRELVYEFCYTEPFPITTAEHDEDLLPKKKKRRLNKKAAKEAANLSTIKCKQPLSHLNLGLVCHQIRNEFFPTFAKHHVFHITNPMIFANDYLSFTPPHRYSNIQHIKLSMSLTSFVCGCEHPYGNCVHAEDGCGGVDRKIRALTQLFEIYPEILHSLESLHFTVNPYQQYYYNSFISARTALVRGTLQMLDKMGEIYKQQTSGKEERPKFLVVPSASSHNSCAPFQIKICRAPTEAWSELPDGEPLHREHCETCEVSTSHGWWRFPVNEEEEKVHNEIWRDPCNVWTTVEKGRMVRTGPVEVKDKCWKVVFLSYYTKEPWNNAVRGMHEDWWSDKALTRSNGRVW